MELEKHGSLLNLVSRPFYEVGAITENAQGWVAVDLIHSQSGIFGINRRFLSDE